MTFITHCSYLWSKPFRGVEGQGRMEQSRSVWSLLDEVERGKTRIHIHKVRSSYTHSPVRYDMTRDVMKGM